MLCGHRLDAVSFNGKISLRHSPLRRVVATCSSISFGRYIICPKESLKMDYKLYVLSEQDCPRKIGPNGRAR